MKKYILALSLLCLAWLAHAQELDYADLDYADPQEYIIADVQVIGTTTRDPNAIRSLTGLKPGTKIMVPSKQMTAGIHKLWDLGIFGDVSLILNKKVQDSIYLTIQLQEQAVVSRIIFADQNQTKSDNLKELIDGTVRVGGIPTANKKTLAINKIKEDFIGKGYLDVEVEINESKDTLRSNGVVLVFDIDKKEKVNVQSIYFAGNRAFSPKMLRKQLSETKQKGTFLKKSKFIEADYEADKEALINFYHSKGYSDASIIKDSVWRDALGQVYIFLDIDEGKQYKYGDIDWKGNSLYTAEQLSSVLGIKKGDIYNPEELSERLNFSLDGRDVSALYMDKGYLFFNIDPKQVAVRGDSIDVEMRIYEGPQAMIDRVTIQGNTRTHDNVIRRTLRTKPGQKFSRSDLIRSQRELINLGYFDPETIQMNTPVNYERGTVDIEFIVDERPSDQLELSAGYGGASGLIGTLGVTFNNFSLQNVKNKESWSPLPTGDGQRLSLRLQSNGRFYQAFNFSLTEPWLGGKKPNAFTIGAALSNFDNTTSNAGKLSIRRIFTGLGTQIRWPDDFFVSNTTLNIENIALDNFNGFFVSNGNFKNFNISQTISRSTISNNMFPMGGSRVSLQIQVTPPYSLFRGDNFWKITDENEIAAIHNEALLDLSIVSREKYYDVDPETGSSPAQRTIEAEEEARKFEWLEYHKWRFDAEWYYNIVGKLVFMTSAKMGYLGNYNSSIGSSPFERFELGGDGLSNQNVGLTGTDIIALRGYKERDINPAADALGGGIIFNKFTAELRYPLSTNPNSTIYATLFAQGGNSWNSFDDYNPFDLKRSVGMGLRVFLPMFGLLGFDYGFGLDKDIPGSPNPGLGELGKFSIILGFEPD